MSGEEGRRSSPLCGGLLLLAVLLASACRWAAERRLRLHADVAAYYAAMRAWAPADAEAARTVRLILATQFMDEARVLELIRDYRPHLAMHREEIAAYHPASPEVQHVHAAYRRAWENLAAGLDAIEQGFSTGDYKRLAAGRRDMTAWKRGLVDVARELRELMAASGVSPGGRGRAAAGSAAAHAPRRQR